MAKRRLLIALFLSLVSLPLLTRPLYAQEPGIGQLKDLSLEELTQMTVTSAGKREQSLSEVASALFVISKKDIKRSSATSIPELLRMVPGLYVAQVNAHTWAITSRGFGGVFTNKLLVLIDGRSVYSPLYSGTYWDVQDYPLEDVERIEVIRGPGGTLWGSNAVNGVINITTKRAKDTQGTLISGSTGKEVNGIGNARYGFKQENLSARVYGRGRIIDDSKRADGGSGDDGFNSAQGGFKLEQKISDATALTIQGDIYSLNLSDRLNVPVVTPPYADERGQQSSGRGGNVITKLTTEGFAPSDKASVQFYFDRANRNDLVARTSVSTYDLETQYELNQIDKHTIIFGGGARTIDDSIGQRSLVVTDRLARTYSLVNGFFQDEITLVPKTLLLTAGVKFEHNEFTGGAWQPSVRGTWHPASDVTLWSAVSRAVRIPSRVTNDVRIPLAAIPPNEQVPLPTLVQLTGNHRGKPEWVTSYESGLRTKASDSVSLDTTFFFADYTDIETFDQGQPDITAINGVPAVLQSLDVQNNGKASTTGVESVFDWAPSQETRIQLWHSFQVVRGRAINGSTDTVLSAEKNNNPVNQLGIRGQFDLPYDFEFNPFIRFVESVPSVRTQAYWEGQVQLAYKASEKLRLSLNVNNALRSDHLEYRSEFLSRPVTKVEQSVFLTVAYQY